MYNQVSPVYAELDFCRVMVHEAEVGAWDDLGEEGEGFWGVLVCLL